jgi:flagellar biosynthesis/type III secretory pathway chaperone
MLLDLCKQKQDSIFEREIETLEELTVKQKDVCDQVEELNDRRRELCSEILPDSEEPISLETVVDSLESEAGKQLDARRLELKQVTRDIQRISRENMRLLEDRMLVFNRLFEELEEEQTQETYDRDSEKEKAAAGEAMIFDEAI